MPKRPKSNQAEDAGMSTNERLMRDVHDEYEKADGLAAILQSLGTECRVPRKRVTVMVVGNHSAGKSSFINWYIGETIQKASVAIETSGFTLVHSGKSRVTWNGPATLQHFKFLDGKSGIAQFEGAKDNFTTEICSSKERHFSTVDFIDTPGLTDGTMVYPYPVEECICWMADHADLVLFFFDPIGQALCKRTMEVVETLNNKPEILPKLHYYLSKADTVPEQDERSKVLVQITLNLQKRIQNTHSFDLPTIYVPELPEEEVVVKNAVGKLCELIEDTINLTVQKTLDKLREDCDKAEELVSAELASDKAVCSANSTRAVQRFFVFFLVGILALVFPMFVMLAKVDMALGVFAMIKPAAGGPGRLLDFFEGTEAIAHKVDGLADSGTDMQYLGASACVLLTTYLLSRLGFIFPKKDELATERTDELARWGKSLEALKASQVKWYGEYQQQSIRSDY